MADEGTTPAPEGQPNAENWESRYTGLQKVVAKRDTDLATRQAALDALRAEKEAADIELATYRQAKVDASEEEAARTQFEALKARFQPARPPIGNNQSRTGWTESGSDYQGRERKGTEQGFPT